MYKNEDIQKLKKAADIRNHIPDTQTIGNRVYAKCPQCGATGKKGMLVTHTLKKDLAWCTSCHHAIAGAINAEMFYQNISFHEAVKRLATQYGLPIETEEEQRRRIIKETSKKSSESFCAQQLKASGLTFEDVTAKVIGKTPDDIIYKPTFSRGGMDLWGNTNPNDDEMLIYYHDLFGMPMKFASRGAAGAAKQYVRVRWSNPLLHSDHTGKAIKYQTPKGAEAKFYIPQKIRQAFQDGQQIETIFIQEGEKKAEKACKHGILSLGIQGIYNIGSKEGGLIKDLQYLIKKCSVRNVVLLFDSDWQSLSKSIENGSDIDSRPTQFAKAVIKFKKYIETLQNLEISVDVWFGNIKLKESGEKGIDDVLCGILKGKEQDLKEDISRTMKTHDGIGEYVDIHKISSLTDYQIFDFWKLRDRQAFLDRHSEELKNLNRIKFGKISYKRNDNGEFIQAGAAGADSKFWGYEYNEKTGKMTVTVQTKEVLDFLQANGFFKTTNKIENPTEYILARTTNNIIHQVGEFQIRDFVYEYVCMNCKDQTIIEHFTSKLNGILGNDKLERLKTIIDSEPSFEPDSQERFYRNCQIRITAHSIEDNQIMRPVWESNVINRNYKRVPIIKNVSLSENGIFNMELTEDGKKCEYLQLLINASNFYKIPIDRMNDEQKQNIIVHLLNKLTAIGYLLTDYRNNIEDRAVIAMDGKMSEVGQSHGRSGKSMVGLAIKKIVPQTTIDGRKLKNDDDYIYSNVSTKTRNIFIDDARVNFDFGGIFQALTGDLNVNPKTMARFVIPYEKAPKMLITTNHAINDDSPSAQARIAYMSFSDWYNIKHTPFDDFGHTLFSDWEAEQWLLFDNLMAECVQLYMRSRNLQWSKSGTGIIAPPTKNLELRQLRQKMGEAFLQWAEIYFEKGNRNRNNRQKRKDMFDNFCSTFPGQKQFVTSSNFKEKLSYYCKYSGLHLNPHKPDKDGNDFNSWKKLNPGKSYFGDRDISGGSEYFTVSDNDINV